MKNDNIINIVLTGTNIKLLSISILLLRFSVGIILFLVGAGKVLGWFGGMVMKMTIQVFTASTGLPEYLIYLSSYTEFIGGFLLIFGLFTRPAAFTVMINMLVATIFTWSKGFIAGGASYPFSLMICAIVIQLSGPLNYSIDSLIIKMRRMPQKFHIHEKIVMSIHSLL